VYVNNPRSRENDTYAEAGIREPFAAQRAFLSKLIRELIWGRFGLRKGPLERFGVRLGAFRGAVLYQRCAETDRLGCPGMELAAAHRFDGAFEDCLV
jgi:hypothetical protein